MDNGCTYVRLTLIVTFLGILLTNIFSFYNINQSISEYRLNYIENGINEKQHILIEKVVPIWLELKENYYIAQKLNKSNEENIKQFIYDITLLEDRMNMVLNILNLKQHRYFNYSNKIIDNIKNKQYDKIPNILKEQLNILKKHINKQLSKINVTKKNIHKELNND